MASELFAALADDLEQLIRLHDRELDAETLAALRSADFPHGLALPPAGEAGRKPYCVMACMMRVLDIGPIEEIWRGTLKTRAIGPHDQPVKQVKNMANPELTRPSIAFIPHSKGRVDGQ